MFVAGFGFGTAKDLPAGFGLALEAALHAASKHFSALDLGALLRYLALRLALGAVADWLLAVLLILAGEKGGALVGAAGLLGQLVYLLLGLLLKSFLFLSFLLLLLLLFCFRL